MNSIFMQMNMVKTSVTFLIITFMSTVKNIYLLTRLNAWEASPLMLAYSELVVGQKKKETFPTDGATQCNEFECTAIH